MSELEKISSFKREIALAETWEDWKNLTIKGSVIADWAKKAGIAINGQNKLGRTRVELEELKGKWLEKNHPSKIHSSRTIQDEGISFDESSSARLISNENDLREKIMQEIEEKQDIITPHKVASGIRKKLRQKEIENIKHKIETEKLLITDQYDIIVIDPPWPYGSFSNYDPDSQRGTIPYPEMSIEDIKNIKLPIKKDAAVFLWTTQAFIWEAKNIIDNWGLEYKALIVWDKEKMGIGRTIRLQCEFCLLAIKGKPIINGASERDIIRESRREHSRKPKVFYEMVERMTIGRRLDYFAREKRENWDVFGIEKEKF